MGRGKLGSLYKFVLKRTKKTQRFERNHAGCFKTNCFCLWQYSRNI